jgi:hypothetical protein
MSIRSKRQATVCTDLGISWTSEHDGSIEQLSTDNREIGSDVATWSPLADFPLTRLPHQAQIAGWLCATVRWMERSESQ